MGQLIYLLFYIALFFFIYWILTSIRKKTKWKPSTGRIVLYTFAILILYGTYPWFYVIDDIEGWIVDENGKPVEGVLVTSRWNMAESIPFMSIDTFAHMQSGILEAKEIVTDKNGRYYFPGFKRVNPLLQVLSADSPDIRAFKKGLYFSPTQKRRFKNYREDRLDFGIFRSSVWDGSTSVVVKMEDDHQRRNASGGISAFVDAVMQYSDCMWTNIPKAYATTHGLGNDFDFFDKKYRKKQESENKYFHEIELNNYHSRFLYVEEDEIVLGIQKYSRKNLTDCGIDPESIKDKIK